MLINYFACKLIPHMRGNLFLSWGKDFCVKVEGEETLRAVWTQSILSALFLRVNWLAGSQQRWPVWASCPWIGHKGKPMKTSSVVDGFLRKPWEPDRGAHTPALCVWCLLVSISSPPPPPLGLLTSCRIFPLNLSSCSNNSHLKKKVFFLDPPLLAYSRVSENSPLLCLCILASFSSFFHVAWFSETCQGLLEHYTEEKWQLEEGGQFVLSWDRSTNTSLTSCHVQPTFHWGLT